MQQNLWRRLFISGLVTLATTGSFADKPNNINPLNNSVPTNSPPTKSFTHFFDAIKNGDPLFYLRLRSEEVQQVQKQNALANTVAVHLGYQTANYYHLSGLLEFTNTTILGHQHYNSGDSTSLGLTRYATTNDPKGTRVDQAFLDYDNLLHTDIKLGRQRIRLDNERFIGNSGWRQMEQTYDGISFYNTAIKNLNLFYAFIARVNRVFGPNAITAFSSNRNHTHITNARYDIPDVGSMIAYEYYINNADVSFFSTNTTGIRFNGVRPFKKIKLLYTAEYAHQSDAANNPVNFSTFYTHFAGGIGFNTKIGDAELDLQREELGGSRSKIAASFRTPYASFHSFQGWAEEFVITPNAGVVDTYANASLKLTHLGDVKLLAIYHHFEKSAGSGTFGNEIDAQISKDLNKYINLTLTFGNFMSVNAETPRTQRIWLILQTPFA